MTDDLVRALITELRNGFMTVTAGPDIDPFIQIKFKHLDEAHRAHRIIIDMARWAQNDTLTSRHG